MSHDILSDVLRSVRLRGVLYYHVSGSRDWVAEAPPSREITAAVMPDSEHVMEYHVVNSGTCWGAVVGEAPVRLETGDIVLFPHGDPHVISSEPGMRAPADAAGYFDRQHERVPFILHLEAREVRVSTTRRNDRVHIEVSDTGPGVPAKIRDHLFEAFQTSGRPGGSGLGLAIAAELVRAHDGEIHLVEGTIGATFRIAIPDRPVELLSVRHERARA